MIDWCLNDVDINVLRFFETKFPAIVYDDALSLKSGFSSEPTVRSQHVDEVNLKNETSLFEYKDERYNVISYNDLFPFNVFSVNDLKLDKDNDDDKIDIKQFLVDIFIEPLHNVRSIDVGTYAQGIRLCLSCLTTTIHEFYWFLPQNWKFCHQAKAISLEDRHFFKLETLKSTMDITEFFKKFKFVCHWANPFKDLKWSNVPGVKLSSLSKLDDTLSSLQALSNLYYIFDGFMDYLWSRELTSPTSAK
ncbi:hypothetical protein Tco_0625300 [Tanacetum coccineum]|uniref:Maturase K n=1 Tax=Tanacetum coccineum TaxID=301880 RepID=A0ABQ4WGG8_9ASTR